MIQIQTLSTLITCIVLPTATVTLLMFLPAIIELKKPHDSGPRLIHESFAQLPLGGFNAFLKGEEGKIVAQLTTKASLFPSFITNLEA